jgi:hypothetical protein
MPFRVTALRTPALALFHPASGDYCVRTNFHPRMAFVTSRFFLAIGAILFAFWLRLPEFRGLEHLRLGDDG